MRTIGVVTGARSDYGIYLPLLHRIRSDPELCLHLVVTGMHLVPDFGLTVRAIEADGFSIGERVEMLLSSDTPEGVAKSMGLGSMGMAQAFARLRPDILVVLGDRFEMHAAALAALPFKIPVAHIHGGELTLGAIDDALRHSMTKLSHLHFVATPEYARRVTQMGEEPWRITLSGALSLDNVHLTPLLSAAEVSVRHGVRLEQPFVLVTYHPVTLEYEQTEWQFTELLAALDACALPVLFTMPNADTGGRVIARMIKQFVADHGTAHVVDNLGTQSYFSAMALAKVMVGNSSSGIVEAGFFDLPVVNVGNRQSGRVRGKNVIDVGYHRSEILGGVRRALSPSFRADVRLQPNPYGDGHAAERIVSVLKAVDLGARLLVKHFSDYPIEVAACTLASV